MKITIDARHLDIVRPLVTAVRMAFEKHDELLPDWVEVKQSGPDDVSLYAGRDGYAVEVPMNEDLDVHGRAIAADRLASAMASRSGDPAEELAALEREAT